MIRKLILPLLAVLMLGFAVYRVVIAQQTPPKLSPPIEPARAPEGAKVSGAGLVEARRENIAVGSHLPGIVTEVYVKVGEKVTKGQKLFRLDDRALMAEKGVKQASLLSAQRQLAKLKQMPRPEELPALEARVREAKANVADQEDLARRARQMAMQRSIADEERSRRDNAARMAREQLSKAEADLALMKAGAWKPDIEVAQASVTLAEAQLRQVETDLSRLDVTALENGEVLQVNVRPGEYVNAQGGTALIVLGDLTRLRVRVDIDEHDIPRFEPGAPARAFLRGDPRQDFQLKFVRVEPYVIPKKSLTGDNTERVDTRVLQVIYEIEPTEKRVYVGQQLDVYVGGKVEKKGP
jgi:HlyD family secretion protein